MDSVSSFVRLFLSAHLRAVAQYYRGLSITGAQYLTGSVFNGLSITGAQQRGVTRPSRRGLLVLTVAAAEGNAPLLAMHFDFIDD